MQNTIFLAMLHSHRIYRDPRTQKYTFGNFEEFIRKEEENIFKSIIHTIHILKELNMFDIHKLSNKTVFHFFLIKYTIGTKNNKRLR